MNVSHLGLCRIPQISFIVGFGTARNSELGLSGRKKKYKNPIQKKRGRKKGHKQPPKKQRDEPKIILIMSTKPVGIRNLTENDFGSLGVLRRDAE